MHPKLDWLVLIVNFINLFSLQLNIVSYFFRIDKLLLANDESTFKMFYNSLNKFYEKKKKSDFSYFKHLKLI